QRSVYASRYTSSCSPQLFFFAVLLSTADFFTLFVPPVVSFFAAVAFFSAAAFFAVGSFFSAAVFFTAGSFFSTAAIFAAGFFFSAAAFFAAVSLVTAVSFFTAVFFAAVFFTAVFFAAVFFSFFSSGVQENIAAPRAGTVILMEFSLSSHSSALLVLTLGFVIPSPPYSFRSVLKISLYFPWKGTPT